MLTVECDGMAPMAIFLGMSILVWGYLMFHTLRLRGLKVRPTFLATGIVVLVGNVMLTLGSPTRIFGNGILFLALGQLSAGLTLVFVLRCIMEGKSMQEDQ